MFLFFWDTLYIFCRSYWETIEFCVYGAPVGKIWRKQDARLAESSSMYRIILPGPHWMLAIVGRIFTVLFSKLILYREKVRDLAFSIASFFRYKPNCSQACVGAFENMNSMKFSWAYVTTIHIILGWEGRWKETREGRKWYAIASEKFSTLMPRIMIRYGTRDATLRSRWHFSVETLPKSSCSRRKLN